MQNFAEVVYLARTYPSAAAHARNGGAAMPYLFISVYVLSPRSFTVFQNGL